MMRVAAQCLILLLIAGGTVGATLGIARTDPSAAGWEKEFQADVPLAVVSLAAIVCGGALRFVLARARSRDAAAEGGSMAAFLQAFESLFEGLAPIEDALEDGQAQLGLEGLHAALDDLLTGPLAAVVENRQALIDELGVGAHARVMGPFASGERRLNRAWSASTDGYFEEAVACVFAARQFLEEAQAELRELLAQRAT